MATKQSSARMLATQGKANNTRRSGGRVKRAVAKAVTGDLRGALYHAFLNADFPDSVRYSKLGNDIINAAQQVQRLTQDQQRGWSAKLSFRTYKTLQAEGVVA